MNSGSCRLRLARVGLWLTVALCACDAPQAVAPIPPGYETATYEARVNRAHEIVRDAVATKNPGSLADAEALLRSAIAMNPDQAMAYEFLGAFHMTAAEFATDAAEKRSHAKEARTAYENAARIEPNAAKHQIALGRCAAALDDYARARRFFLRALDLDENQITLLVDLAWFDYKEDRLAEAEPRLREYLRRVKPGDDPINEIRAKEFLGRILTRTHHEGEAQIWLEDSARQYDAWLAEHGNFNYWGCPYQALGKLYSKTGDYDAETEMMVKSAEQEAFRVGMQRDAAIRLYRIGDYERSLAFFDRAVDLEGRAEDRLAKALVLLALRRYGEAEEIVREFGSDRTVASWLGLPAWLGKSVVEGHLALVHKDFALSRERFVSATREISPGAWWFARSARDEYWSTIPFLHEMGLLGLAWTASNEARHDEAIAAYDRILAVVPGHLLAMLGKGNALAGLQRMDEAEAVFRSVLTHYPENKYAITELGIIRYNKGELDAAQHDFELAVEKDPTGYTCPYEGLGLVYLRRGEDEKAKTFLTKAIEIDPDIEYKKYNALARIYMKEGRFDEAARLLEKSISNYPHDDESARLSRELESLRGARLSVP
ncbi:MAG: tetratricopeptide repeat protein [Deltaproteobacteria bacterium]|nr:tetratricopeptide repeat protein [Deltaproteobacteria bacterium]